MCGCLCFQTNWDGDFFGTEAPHPYPFCKQTPILGVHIAMWTKGRSIQPFRTVVATLSDFNHPYVEIGVLETHLLKVSALCGQRQSHGGDSGSLPLFNAWGSWDLGVMCSIFECHPEKWKDCWTDEVRSPFSESHAYSHTPCQFAFKKKINVTIVELEHRKIPVFSIKCSEFCQMHAPFKHPESRRRAFLLPSSLSLRQTLTCLLL